MQEEQIKDQIAMIEQNANNQEDMEGYVSITEAAKINNVTRQAIYVAIKQKKLRAQKDATRWTINVKDLEEYRNQKYSRSKSTFDGELLFDNEKGFFSVNQAAKMLGCPAQKVYYATRIGMLTAVRKGAAWVIHISDVKEYQEKYLNRKTIVNPGVSSEAM
jgi:excisionase family DNA binding protein